MKDKEESWVPLSRKILSDYRNGIISKNEYRIYCWLHHNANPYGISVTSLSDLAGYLNSSENYVNGLVISLKGKKYLHYDKRTGRRGSFEVRFAGFILPSKVKTSLDRFFETVLVRVEPSTKVLEESELEQSSAINSQNLKTINSLTKSIVSGFSVDDQVRASNNDNNNENKSRSISLNEETNLLSFNPKDSDQWLYLDIAEKLGEKNIGFMLSAHKRYGREFIEKVWRLYQEEASRITIGNPGAYFNAMLERVYSQRN